MPCGDMADALEAIASRLDVRAQHLGDPVAEREVRSANDTGAGAGLELSSLSFLGDARHELGFADRP